MSQSTQETPQITHLCPMSYKDSTLIQNGELMVVTHILYDLQLE